MATVEVKKIPHRKSQNHITEYIDRVSIAAAQSPNGTVFNISMGRDVADILHETVVGDTTTLTEDSIDAYRLNVATISMSEESAKSLAELILQMINSKPQAGRTDQI